MLAHARPAYAAGIRAAIASVTPLLFASVLPLGGATWMSLAGLNGALIDRGGPYRMRAITMSALAFASALAVIPGSILGQHLLVAVVVTFLLAFVCGLARAWTDVGPGFGVTVLVTYVIALAIPSTPEVAFARAGFILAGGAWAMLLAIILWPIRPYRPVRLRITECYRAIARYIEASVEDIRRGADYDPARTTSYVVAVRQAIEAARVALAVSRGGRTGETSRGERLLVLHEMADQVFVHLIALMEESDAAIAQSPRDTCRTTLADTLDAMAVTARELATSIESEMDLPLVRVTWNAAPLRTFNAGIAAIIDRVEDYAVSAAALAASLNSGAPVPASDAATIDVAEPPPEPRLFSLAAVLHPGSIVVHHGLRIAAVTSAAVLIAGLLHLNHGYWVSLTAVVVLQPFPSMTRQKALQRIGGTIAGGIIAAGLSALFQSGGAVIVLIAIFTMLCVALLPLNYGAYAVFGTPAFVLLAESSAGDWHLAGLRIVNTLIGGSLALAGSRFWPSDERGRMAENAAAALRANDALLMQTISLVAGDGGTLGDLRDARRAVAQAALDAEDSFQRLLSDRRGRADTLEPVMTFLVFTRRIAASTGALAISASADTHAPADALHHFGGAAHAVLADLSDAITWGRAPTPFPAIGVIQMEGLESAPLVQQRVNRLARQLKLLHGAVTRWLSVSADIR